MFEIPTFIPLNPGTTVKGAVDDLDMVIQILEETGFTQDRFYIHCDGALFGLMMPFVKWVRHYSWIILLESFIWVGYMYFSLYDR